MNQLAYTSDISGHKTFTSCQIDTRKELTAVFFESAFFDCAASFGGVKLDGFAFTHGSTGGEERHASITFDDVSLIGGSFRSFDVQDGTFLIFRNVNASGADFDNVHIGEDAKITFDDVNLTGAKIPNITVTPTGVLVFKNANLSGTDWSLVDETNRIAFQAGADLSNSTITHAQLVEALEVHTSCLLPQTIDRDALMYERGLRIKPEFNTDAPALPTNGR